MIRNIVNGVYVIAEAGVNHNGDVDMAFALVDAAVNAGANAVKFQTFKAKHLVTDTAEKAEYQQRTTDAEENQLQMLRRLELDHSTHRELQKYCGSKNIEFLSTAFDMGSLRFLAADLGLGLLKIASGEITNAPLVLAHACTGCDLIVSTGMATMDEIEDVLSVIAFGFGADKKTSPGQAAFKKAFSSEKGQESLRRKVTLLHCTTEYPAPVEDVNLKAMETMSSAFKLPVGYSDHTKGIDVPIAAVAMGAVIIEKHFTLDNKLEGPDHVASLEPAELEQMVDSIRRIENAIGDGEKIPQPSELKNKAVARKSLVAAIDIGMGARFSAKNIVIKRPGGGMSPMRYWEMLEKTATKDFKAGEAICD